MTACVDGDLIVGPAVALAQTTLRGMLMYKAIQATFTLALAVTLSSGGVLLGSRLTAINSAQPQQVHFKEESKPTADERKAKTDLHGDPLPDGAVMRLGTTRFRHAGSVYAIAYSADGRLIATGNAPETIPPDNLLGASVVVWDAETGRRLRTWYGHAHVVRSVAFSPDSKRVVVVNGFGKVHLYDVAADKELRCFDTESPEKALFSPDGSLLVTDSHSVRRWDVVTGNERSPLRGHGKYITGLAIAGDGETMATCAMDGTVRVWDREGRERHMLKIPKKYGLSVALSPDGKRLVCAGFEPEIHCWDTATGQEVWRVKTEDRRLSSQSFSPDGKILATGGSKLRLWDAATGREVRVIDNPQRTKAHAYEVMMLVIFSPDSKRIATAGGQSALSFWDPTTGQEISGYQGHQHAVLTGSFSPDGKTLATVSDEPFVRLWDLKSARAGTFAFGLRNVRSAAFAPDGRTLAVSGAYDSLGLWDLATGELLRTFTPKNKGVGGGPVMFSADGKTLASSTSGCQIHFWDAATGREGTHLFQGTSDGAGGDLFRCPHFVLAPDGKTVATTRGQGAEFSAVVWDAARGRERIRHAGPGVPAAFSPDGRLLALLSEKHVRLLDTGTLKEVRRTEGEATRLRCAAFSPDGRTLATAGSDGAVCLWETATGERRDRLMGHEGGVNFVIFSPSGLRLASGGEDHTALIWDLSSNAAKGSLTAKEREALWIALGGDAAPAYRAMRALAAAPDQAAARPSVSFLAERLRPEEPVEDARLKRLIEELDSDQFTIRTRASQELEELGELAEKALHKALVGSLPLEARRRVENLLHKVEARIFSSKQLLTLRALEVLEHIGTPEAKHVLQNLAKGAPEARLTQEAKASLERLSKRP